MIIVVRTREVKIYITRNGRKPFIDWMESLKDKKARYHVKRRLNRIELGNLGDVESVGGGVKEVKIHIGPGYRIYFGEKDEKIILLLCGGDKSSQQKDIQKAMQFWQDYISR